MNMARCSAESLRSMSCALPKSPARQHVCNRAQSSGATFAVTEMQPVPP